MTDTIKLLRELHQAATAGPWEIVRGDEWTTDIGTPEGEYDDGRKRHWNVASVNKLRDEWEANRALIAAMHEALPGLLDRLESAEARLAELEGRVRDAPERRLSGEIADEIYAPELAGADVKLLRVGDAD